MTDPADPDTWDAPGPAGATPLDPDDAEGLRLGWIATRADLNTAEQADILAALRRPRWRRPTTEYLLDDAVAVRRLHKDMLGTVWTWAGVYRPRETSVGVAPEHINVAVRSLVDDARYWFDGDRPMTPDEAGWTFHHRLVKIHPFRNGNGRHARALTDLLLRAKGQQPFTWGRQDLNVSGTTRATYLTALRAADAGDYVPLAGFVRS